MTKSELVHRIETYIPEHILNWYRKMKWCFTWHYQQIVYATSIIRIRAKKKPIKVVFIVQDSAIWKYDSVYQYMEKNSSFEPLILVCPLICYYQNEQATEIFMRTYTYFAEKGYNVLKASEHVYDVNCVSVHSLCPDIIFYSNLWTIYLHPKYRENALSKYLKCYVNYGFSNTSGTWGYASTFHQLLWRYFAECEDIKTIALEAQPREMKNIVVTGYPIYDEYIKSSGNPAAWKVNNPKIKRIIWAPHHSISTSCEDLQLSTFEVFYESMLDIAIRFKDYVQFIFKPHPLLKQSLYNHPKWGKEKTDDYYEKWTNGENTALVTGAYMDLFKSSDAMIHDCGSFIVEYLYTKKPVMYLGNSREGQSNIVGLKAYDAHYHGTTIEDVENFLLEVVLTGNDSMKEKRIKFYNEVLLPPNGKTVAENIINEIIKGIYGKDESKS